MVLIDLHSNQSLKGLRSTQDDLRFGGSAQGAVVGHTGKPNPNINYDAPHGGGLLYKGNMPFSGGRKMKKHGNRRTRKHRKKHTRRGKRGGYNVQFKPGHQQFLLGRSAGHASFERGMNHPVHAPHKLGAGVQHSQHQQGGGASLYPSPFGDSYYTTNMENTHDLRGSYPEVVSKVHGCHTGGRRKTRKQGRKQRSRKHSVKRNKKQRKTHKSRRHGKSHKSRRGRGKRGGYHQYLNGSARSFGYLTNGNVSPHDSALAGHGLMGAYKMGGYGMKGNYNHFTGKNT